MEKIISIKEIHAADGDEGFAITTDKQTIKFLINMVQDCCENPGYIITNDETNSFIGAEILSYATTDDRLSSTKSEEIDEIIRNLDEGDIIFFNIETDRGTLQFVAYNQHNGYYGHRCKIESEQLNIEEML